MHRILLSDSNDSLDDVYGNAIFKSGDRRRLSAYSPWGQKQEALVNETYGYMPVEAIANDLSWAEDLWSSGYAREAFYHFCLLERSLKSDGGRVYESIRKKRMQCEQALAFFPKRRWTIEEREDKEKIVFFVKVEERGLVEIDPQRYGIPKQFEADYLEAFTALEKKRWIRAGALLRPLLKKLTPGSAAFYENSWRLARLERQLDLARAEDMGKVMKNVTKLEPDVLCRRLTDEIRSAEKPKYEFDAEWVTPSKEIDSNYENYWTGRMFSTHSLRAAGEAEPHRPLPSRSKFNYKDARIRKQTKVLEYFAGQLPSLSRETSSQWRLLGNQYVRVGDFKRAGRIFLRLAKLTKDSGDAFKSVACQLHQPKQNDLDFNPAVSSDMIRQYRKSYPDQYLNSLIYLEGQIAFRARRWQRARLLFGEIRKLADHPARRSADFYCGNLDRQLLRISIPNSVSHDGYLKLKLTRRNVRDIRFRFFQIKDELSWGQIYGQDLAGKVKKFFELQKAKVQDWSFEKDYSFSSVKYGHLQKSTLSLKLPGEGLWIVEMLSGTMKKRFAAICHRGRAFSIQFPGSSILVFHDSAGQAIPELNVFGRFGRFLGQTDSDGALVTKLERDYWRTAQNDSGNLSEESSLHAVTLYCAKPGMFFQCSVKLGVRIAGNSAGRPVARLYVATDRPLYQAGETLHFRGVLRIAKALKGRRPKGRYTVAAGERVQVVISHGDGPVFKKTLFTNEFGSFHGSFRFPNEAPRQKYWIEVQYGEVVGRAALELRDFNKVNGLISFQSEERGFRIFAGNSWGAPIPGASIECFVGKKPVPLSLNSDGFAFLELKSGDHVSIALKKGKELLLVKSQQFIRLKENSTSPPPKSVSSKKSIVSKQESRVSKRRSKAELRIVEDQTDPFQLTLARAYDPKSHTIALKLTSKSKKPWSAWIALGDTAAFDYRRIHSKGESKLVTLPVTRACDPCVYAHVLFERGQHVQREQLRIPVRAALLKVKVETDKSVYEPGDTVKLNIWTARLSGLGMKAEASLAVVDEMIFSLKDDKTPDIYDFFYSDRGTECHLEKIGRPFFAAQDFLLEDPITLRSEYQGVNVEQQGFPLFYSISDAYGIGGGGRFRRGAYGQRWGKGSLANEGGSEGTEGAAINGLRWLRNHQNPSGLWDNQRFFDNCRDGEKCHFVGPKNMSVFGTGLAVRSFFECGHTSKFGTFKKSVSLAFKALIADQKTDGSIHLDKTRFAFLNHCAATDALSNCCKDNHDAQLKMSAQRALDFIVASKIKNSGWGFDRDSKRANILMTAWAIHALKAGREVGLSVPVRAFEDALAFVESVTDSRGWTWFEKTGEEAPDWFKNKSEFVDYPEWTAMGLFVRLAAKQSRRTPAFYRGVQLLRRDYPQKPLTSRNTNFQYFYFAAIVMYEVGGFTKPEWYRVIALIENAQQKEDCADGSWSISGRWGSLLGRLGSTAVATSTILTYCRYERDYRGDKSHHFYEPPIIRVHFPNTAYWNPSIQTNDKGVYRGTFKLPDTITSFRLTSRGVSKDTDVGQVIRWIRVRKDFFVRLQCPKYVYQGDVCQIRGDLFDYQRGGQKIEVELSGGGFQNLSSALQTSGSIGGGMAQPFYWTLQAKHPGTLKLVLSARCGTLSDAVELTIPVRIFGESKQSIEKKV
ncbi:MAG: alpha-2-macroglobulin family protein, partial [Planctomycetota bacterium]|nr:alpha-2-macroglobulin family protein [Planctomycetota bacterium]